MKGTQYSNTRRKRPTEIDIHDKRDNSEKKMVIVSAVRNIKTGDYKSQDLRMR